MKRLLWASVALIMLLSACSAPAKMPESSTCLSDRDTYGIYEFTFDVEQLSGWPVGDWDFVYTYNGEKIKSGHRITFSLELFSFHSVHVDVIERDAPDNKYSAAFPVAICDGGSGKTEMTVTGSNGKTATFKIICNVTQVGKADDIRPYEKPSITNVGTGVPDGP